MKIVAYIALLVLSISFEAQSGIDDYMKFRDDYKKDVDDFMVSTQLCSESCPTLLDKLKASDLVDYGFIFPDKTESGNLNFRVKVPSYSNLFKMGIRYISQLVLPDTLGNRSVDRSATQNLAETYEIALIDFSGGISYEHPLCPNVLRAESLPELIGLYKELFSYAD